MGSKHACLPNLSFFALAVADDGIGTVILPRHFCGNCHAAGGGNTLSERACGHIHAGDMLHIRVSLQDGVRLPQCFQHFYREIPAQCQRRIKPGCGVPFGQHQPVAIRILRFFRIDPHFLKIQKRQKLGNRKRPARMTGLCCVCRFQNTEPDLCRCMRQTG
ncbi:unknown [Clostridium sp. CAG:448]|nr:unknown [Clostridium sp. CAG:448]